MATPVGVADIVVRWTSSGDSDPMVSTFSVEPTLVGPTGQQVHDAVFTAINAWPVCDAPSMLTGWTWTGVQTTYNAPTGPEVYEGAVLVAGNRNGGGATSNTAVLVQKRTALGGRRHRGRMFLPPIYFLDSEFTNNGFIDSGPLATYQGWMNQLLADLTTEGVPMVLTHSGTATDSQTVTSLNVQTQLATQRRRMRS